MRIETTPNREHTIDIDVNLAIQLKVAMDIYYDTVEHVKSEHDVQGTVDSVHTNIFKNKTLLMYVDNELTPFTIGAAVIGSFGCTLYFRNSNAHVNISYDSIESYLKKL